MPPAGAGVEPVNPSEARALGQDSTSTVSVTVDEGLVVEVTVDEWWRDRLAPAGLSEAVLFAYRTALGRSVAASIAAGRSAADAGIEAGSALGLAMSDEDDDQWLHKTAERVEQNGARLRAVEQSLREPAAQSRVVSGRDGHVRLTVIGSAVTAVEIDGRARAVPGSRLAAELLAAFQEAQRG